jgi:mRNA-degrading endonuclease HigB of HigAB toxin-antitoxin module
MPVDSSATVSIPQATNQATSACKDAQQAHWTSPDDIGQVYATASIFANNRVVFNISEKPLLLATDALVKSDCARSWKFQPTASRARSLVF